MPNTVLTLETDAKAVLQAEAEAILRAADKLGPGFAGAVESILAATGRLVVTGIGKSAHIAQKIVATLNSTGTPSLFMHAAEAIHGDLGMVQPGDVVLFLSKSGDTPEVKQLVPLVKHAGVQILALVGNLDSYLAVQADYVIDASVLQEADPNNLAPTTSTTVALALGDALAVCLLKRRQFTDSDFAKYHPGGALGKRLYLRVQDILVRQAPIVAPGTPLKEVIMAISQGRMGATLVVNTAGMLVGIVTDGDLRRMLERHEHPFSLTAQDILSKNPKTIASDALAYDALRLLEAHSISQLVVLDDTGKPSGMIHLHDILNEGIR